jgi:hypothetical protein
MTDDACRIAFGYPTKGPDRRKHTVTIKRDRPASPPWCRSFFYFITVKASFGPSTTKGPLAPTMPTNSQLKWIPCECCGGSGEIIRNTSYSRDPINDFAEPCQACEGTGRECVEDNER